ncbi:hypothetical protein AAHH78_41775, partial [Burkholderia pseudomallei]
LNREDDPNPSSPGARSARATTQLNHMNSTPDPTRTKPPPNLKIINAAHPSHEAHDDLHQPEIYL